MRLTSREQEIVNILKKNPLISQEDLADIFGITRSSVAVHISNLMKKGVIKGRGYVFNEKASITILGECLLEINIFHEENAKAVIDLKHLAIPIEISTIFSNYGIKPRVLTFLGNDEIGGFFLNQLQNLELDTSTVFKHTNKRTYRRVYINHEMTYSERMSDKDYNKAISSREWAILNCDWLIIENQFIAGIIERILPKKSGEIPRLCTHIIGGNWLELPDYLTYFSIVVMGIKNINEGPSLINRILGLDINSEQIFVITDGNTEIITLNKGKVSNFSLLPNQSFSIDDKIPAFLAGFIYGILNNYPIRQAIRIALGST